VLVTEVPDVARLARPVAYMQVSDAPMSKRCCGISRPELRPIVANPEILEFATSRIRPSCKLTLSARIL
jgi:hypothetical protein